MARWTELAEWVGPTPDPGNAPPEAWAEDLDPDEVEAIAERLRRETEDGA